VANRYWTVVNRYSTVASRKVTKVIRGGYFWHHL